MVSPLGSLVAPLEMEANENGVTLHIEWRPRELFR